MCSAEPVDRHGVGPVWCETCWVDHACGAGCPKGCAVVVRNVPEHVLVEALDEADEAPFEIVVTFAADASEAA